LAVVIAITGLRISGPIARHAIHVGFLANAVAILLVFALAYAVLSLLGRRLARRIPGAVTTGRADKALGVVFGLVRGVVALGVLFLLFSVATPPERTPRWVKHAALYPLSRAAGHVLIALGPEGSAVAHKVVGGPGETPSSDGPGYDAGSRKSVDDLVEKTR
ncbi:MAG TPA: CvpA family protein, partial [Caulobacteraceae bacterium]|nr:CvpA family protein [Caulobacteraceae bacterium]